MNVFTARFLAALASIAGCGGSVTTSSGGGAGSEAQGGSGTVASGPGGSGSTGTAGGPSTVCTSQECAGLPAMDGARICPDGALVQRTFCTRNPSVGLCYYDFPACLPASGAADGSAGRVPSGQCSLVRPSDPGKPPGTCSLAGRWFLNSYHGSIQSAGVIEFDADGSYYGGPIGTDLSNSYTYDGAYSYYPDAGNVSSSVFRLLNSCGDGCNGSAAFSLQFSALQSDAAGGGDLSECAVATLKEGATACTDGRTFLAGNVTLTRQ